MATTAVGNPYVESSDLVANYPGVSETLAERIDVVGVNPFADAAARSAAIPSPVEGQMSSLSDTDSVERYDGSSWVAVGAAGGKILQVVRATDTTDRTTTSTTFVDITGMSVTITPSSATSTILLIVTGRFGANGSYSEYQITDSSNTAISGAEAMASGLNTATAFRQMGVMIAYASPATTSATTYKARFKTQSASFAAISQNAFGTGQIYAIEVAA